MSKEHDRPSAPCASNPAEPAPVSVSRGRHWGLVVGLIANALAAWPSFYYFHLPRGAEYDGDSPGLEVLAHLLPVALLAALVGLPLAFWGIRRRPVGQNAAWGWWAVALNVSPFWLGLALLSLAVRGLVETS